MDQFREFALAHLFGLEAKHEQQSIDYVGFTRAVWTDDARKGLAGWIAGWQVGDIPCGTGQ